MCSIKLVVSKHMFVVLNSNMLTNHMFEYQHVFYMYDVDYIVFSYRLL